MLRVIELFSGIGSQTQALKNIGVDHQFVCVCEIDRFAHKSYEAIHGETENLGDITKVDQLPVCDLLTYSFPCTDLSVAGQQKGMSRDSGTRSGLLWEVERLLKCSSLPKYLLMENVKPLVGEKFIGQFNEWQSFLWSLGYRNFWQVLNAKDYGVPQNRERVFMVSILGECEGYSFPMPAKLIKQVKDVLQDSVEDKYFLSEKMTKYLQTAPRAIPPFDGSQEYAPTICSNYSKNSTDIFRVKVVGDLNIPGRHESANRVYGTDGVAPAIVTGTGGGHIHKILQVGRGFNKGGEKEICPSITSHSFEQNNFVSSERIRRLTPLECWRLMGFTDEQFAKARAVNSDSQLYKQAGNSIVVQVLEGIFRSLLCEDKGDVEPMQLHLF